MTTAELVALFPRPLVEYLAISGLFNSGRFIGWRGNHEPPDIVSDQTWFYCCSRSEFEARLGEVREMHVAMRKLLAP